MALLDYIVLQKPSVIILPGNSILGVVANGGTSFGTIVNIYSTSDKYSIGQNVNYITAGQRLFIISQYQYAVIDEANILYPETALP